MQGPLTFSTAPTLLASDWQGDLSLAGVTHIDSAGLALLLELKRRARTRQVVLGFSQVPPTVLRLAEHFGVAQILGMKSSSGDTQ